MDDRIEELRESVQSTSDEEIFYKEHAGRVAQGYDDEGNRVKISIIQTYPSALATLKTSIEIGGEWHTERENNERKSILTSFETLVKEYNLDEVDGGDEWICGESSPNNDGSWLLRMFR